MDQIVAVRTNPLRRPKGFEPTVQRWSAGIPTRYSAYRVLFMGVHAPSEEQLASSALFSFAGTALARPDGPDVVDHARHLDADGQANHIIAAYWADEANYTSWWASESVESFWADPARLAEGFGYYRESLRVPVGQQETLYWADYPAGLGRSDKVAMYPTPYCGYFGAMRDRMPLAATQDFPTPLTSGLQRQQTVTRGRRLMVTPPENLAVIRSATYWGRCDQLQREDFETNLRGPLERGMDYLLENPVASGCCSLRYQQSLSGNMERQPEAHALGYFLSLSHLEDWAERHASHHAIFAAAIRRYQKYGTENQLRTWHEVFVLPGRGQHFEYINCSENTGLLPWFDALEVD